MDYLVKALAYDGKVRAYAARTTDMVNEGQRRHGTCRQHPLHWAAQ